MLQPKVFAENVFLFSSLYLSLRCYKVLLMRTFRHLDISLTGFNWFKISKSQQMILNMKNDISPYCQSSDMQDKCVTSRGNEKKWLQVFLYTTNSCHSCNSFLYLRFRVGINNFRTIVLQEFFPYLLLLYRQPLKIRRKRKSKKIHFC